MRSPKRAPQTRAPPMRTQPARPQPAPATQPVRDDARPCSPTLPKRTAQTGGFSLAGRLFGYSVAHQEASAEIAADGAAALMRSRAYLIRLAPDSYPTSTRPLPG